MTASVRSDTASGGAPRTTSGGVVPTNYFRRSAGRARLASISLAVQALQISTHSSDTRLSLRSSSAGHGLLGNTFDDAAAARAEKAGLRRLMIEMVGHCLTVIYIRRSHEVPERLSLYPIVYIAIDKRRPARKSTGPGSWRGRRPGGYLVSAALVRNRRRWQSGVLRPESRVHAKIRRRIAAHAEPAHRPR